MGKVVSTLSLLKMKLFFKGKLTEDVEKSLKRATSPRLSPEGIS